MQNLQNLQNLSSFSRKNSVGSVTLQSYIKSLSGLVAYYPMDETSGNMINRAPATLGSYDGTVSGVTQGVTGQSGKAYSFDGVNDVVTLPNLNVSGVGLLSIGAIINVVDTTLTKTIYFTSTNSGVNTSRLFFALDTAEKLQAGGRSAVESYQSVTTTNALSAGTHLVGATFDVANDTVKIYVDGAEVSVTGTIAFTNATFAAENAAAVAVGAQNTGVGTYQSFFNSTMQHMFICHGYLITGTQWLAIADLAGL